MARKIELSAKMIEHLTAMTQAASAPVPSTTSNFFKTYGLALRTDDPITKRSHVMMAITDKGRAELAKVAAPEPSYWGWWYGRDDESGMNGPFDTRQAAIDAAVHDGSFIHTEDEQDVHRFHVVHAEQAPVRLADWIDVESIIERANEDVADSDRVAHENDEGPWITPDAAQEADLLARFKAVCDYWQKAHGLVFTTYTFSRQEAGEDLAIPAEAEDSAA